MAHGIIENWDDVEEAWPHIFDSELNVNPKEHSILLTNDPLSPIGDKMTAILFEQFDVSAAQVSIPTTFSSKIPNNLTDVAFRSVKSIPHIPPTRLSYAFSNALTRLDHACREVTNFIAKILSEGSNPSFYTVHVDENVQAIREKLAFLAENPENETIKAESSSKIEREYKLPDGQVIAIGEESFHCTKALLANIFLFGGNAIYTGNDIRFPKEISILSLAAKKTDMSAKSNLQSPTQFKISMNALFPGLQDRCVTKREYEEFGGDILRLNSRIE